MSVIFGHLGQDLLTKDTKGYRLKNKANIGVTNTGTSAAWFGFHKLPPGSNYELPGLELRESIDIRFENGNNELLIVYKDVPKWYVNKITSNPNQECS